MEPTVVITLPEGATDELIARLAEAFPDAVLEQPADILPDVSGEAAKIEQAITSAVTAAPRLGDMVAQWWVGLPLSGWGLIAVMIGIMAGVYAVEKAAARLIRFNGGAEPLPALNQRLPRGLLWLLWHGALLAMFAAVCTSIFAAVMRPDPMLAGWFRNVLQVVVVTRVKLIVIEAIVAPHAPARRLMAMTSAEAAQMVRPVAVLGAALIATGVLRTTLLAATGPGPAGHLGQILCVVLGGLVGAWFFMRIAAPVRAVLHRAIGEARIDRGGLIPLLARHWAWLYIALILLDAVLKAVGILGLLGPQAAAGSGQAVLLMVLAPLGVAALRVLGNDSADSAAAEGAPRGGMFFGLLALGEGAFQLTMAFLLARAWGVDPLDRTLGGFASVVPRVFEAAAMLVIGIAIWQAIAAFLTTRDDRLDDDLDEEERRTRRRMATILPVIRGVSLGGVALLTGMTALAALGVNIAPLLASAGVLGLAIGFGAQRLVADVISGLLYLYEDAFRLGEYIEVTGGKGRVEKISLRSVRLRHPRGPVYTIPFSAMGTVQNHSRDFATMKFSFAVPAGTDLEKVRKLVKKAGEAMKEDPEVADKIIEPLKSQGAVAIQGPSYQIGIKFTAKPGEQFAVRRKAFIAVSRALEENGIKLYAPQLTINGINDTGAAEPVEMPG